ncbi:MAG: VCBS repeat-containing protein, partial [Thermoanaerobaculia bacterium]
MLLVIAVLTAAPAIAEQATLVYPEELGDERLERDREVQLKAAESYAPFHDFRFRDRREASGIGFRHRIVDDAGKHYKAVHYDHGNGVAVADADGDGRHDLYFTTQLGRNELWKNLGGGRFEDVTAAAGVGLEDRVSITASFADFDNDGDQDLFVTTVRMGNVLFENDGGGRFRDVTRRAGVDFTGHSSAAVFFDYDRDGFLDLLVTNVGAYTTDEKGFGGYWVGFQKDAFRGHLHPERFERSTLYKNRGDGTFEDVSEKVLLVDRSWSGDAAFTDLNRDGYPDLYVLNMQGDDHYYENVGGSFFVEKRAQLFRKSPWGA